jgi:organic hydroperoxide reductase OsmC/OhrA
MHPYPHTYSVSARGAASGLIPLTSAALPAIETAPPPQFDGPGGAWSPETLLVAAVADCFMFTFRALARVASFAWEALECHVDGTLDRAEGGTRFTGYHTRATLTVAAGADRAKAHQLLERAEKVCLIANSLNGTRTLDVEIVERPG